MNLPRFTGCIFAVLLLTAVGYSAPQAFEGKVSFLMTTRQGKMPMTYYMKGGLIRTEIAAPGGPTAVMLLDPVKREVTMLLDEQKMYMVHALPAPAAGNAEAAGAPPEVQRTGEVETILGHKCEKFIVKTADSTSEIWAAEGMGMFMNPGMGGPMGRGRPAPNNAWEAELASRGFFPLRVVSHNASGKETFRMEATEIDTSAPADSLFAPPPDYKKFEMPSLPGMGGLNPFGH